MRKPDLLSRETLELAADCLRTLAHPLRLRLVDILMQGKFPVHELARMCGLPPAQTSEHLRLLKNCGLLAAERDGRTVYYRIDDPRLPGLLDCIRDHCGEETTGDTEAQSQKKNKRP